MAPAPKRKKAVKAPFPRVKIRQLPLPFEPLTPEIIAREHRGIIFKTILPRLPFFERRGISVEDLAQSAFIHLTQVAPQYDSTRGAPSTYISHVTNNFLSSIQKKLKRSRKPLELDGDPKIGLSLDARVARLWKQRQSNPTDAQERSRRIKWIEKSIPQLSPKSQMVARLFLEGKNLREIGQILLSEGVLYSRKPLSYNNIKMAGMRAFHRMVNELTNLMKRQKHNRN